MKCERERYGREEIREKRTDEKYKELLKESDTIRVIGEGRRLPNTRRELSGNGWRKTDKGIGV